MQKGKGDRAAQRARYKLAHPEKVREQKARSRARKAEPDYPFLDGESWNDDRGQAKLVYLSCYSPKRDQFFRIENTKGIGTVEALSWMVQNLPGAPLKQRNQQHSLIAWYFGGYDTTLILRELPAWLHYLLLHPERRRFRDLHEDDSRAPRVHPIRWKGFTLDWMNNMFTVENAERRVTVYDIARYYQCSFMRSITDWKVGTKEELAAIEAGKKGRSTFDESQLPDIKTYCDLEVKLGSKLWQKLREAHVRVDLKPRKWFGPGQTAKAMLTKMYVDAYGEDLIGPGRGEVRWKREIRHARLRIPRMAWTAFASAFFGGRFENSRYGVVNQKTWTADIASAYPYALSKLPCVIHGEWHYLSRPSIRDLRKATYACVRYELPPHDGRETLAWAPLPFRSKDGSICYPVNATGWAWLPEIESARKMGFDPNLLEAWVFKSKCNCPVYRGQPSVLGLYHQRILLGKDGAGMVLKFALNSGYGVKAQVLGIHEARSLSPFQSFVEAGMITSITRAKLCDVIAQDPASVLMVNTDSVTSTRELDLDLSLAKEPEPSGKFKPELGAWDLETNEKGVTLVKQGIYFDRDFKKLKARGIGRDVLERNAKQVEAALVKWIAGGPKQIELAENRQVFHGQRQCVQGPHKLEPEEWGSLAYCASVGRTSQFDIHFKKRDYYGSWSLFQQKLSFATLPKRESVFPDGRLLVRDMSGGESAPYQKALDIAEMIHEQASEEILDDYLNDFPDFEESFKL